MSVKCSDCGGNTTWDDDAGSAICTSCGTLTDPSQSILTDHTDQPYNPAIQSTGLWNGVPNTLKGFRAGLTCSLSGQDNKEARDRKNNFAMAGFINSLALSLNAPGLSPRAANIFTQAMSSGRFRWGRKAKLVAGACLAIALRESKRPDSLHDIAFLLSEPFATLGRTLTAVIFCLQIPSIASDASVYLPTLQAHLNHILYEDSPQLPPPLVAQLKLISLRSAANISGSLFNLLARLGPDHHINTLSSSPTSCALFLLGLEAVARTPFNQISVLAACLSTRCHTSRSVVMTRYKLIQDEIALWIEKVPWLAKYKREKGRAKVGKRTVVARGLTDVLQFQEDIWNKTEKPVVDLETTDGEDDEDEDEEIDHKESPPTSLTPLSTDRSHIASHPNKRQKIRRNPLRDATHFLLNPLSAPIPSCSPTIKPRAIKAPSVFFQDASDLPSPLPITICDPPPAPHPLSPPSSSVPLTSYILTAPSAAALTNPQPPSRLQLLAASRGGTGEDEIADEELFTEGELELLFRGEKEVEALKERFEWGQWGEEEDNVMKEDQVIQAKKRKIAGGNNEQEAEANQGGKEKKKTKRINLEALEKFLENPAGDEKDDECYDIPFSGFEQISEGEEWDDKNDNTNYSSLYDIHTEFGLQSPCTPPPTSNTIHDDSEIVLDEWRPLSPETGRSSRTATSHYGQEYD